MTWVIAGKPDDSIPIVGQEYEVRHSRKGTFTGCILRILRDWAWIRVTEGEPRFASFGSRLDYDGIVSVRDSLTYLIEIETEQ